MKNPVMGGVTEEMELPAAAEKKAAIAKKSGSRRVDRGKVLALGRAGWKVADIAREVRCSETTVRNVIRDELDKEKNNGGLDPDSRGAADGK